MLNINVTVRDVALNISHDITLNIDEHLQVQQLAAHLVKSLKWPEKDIKGKPIQYVLSIDRASGRIQLTGDELIRNVGFLNGDIITIGSTDGTPTSRQKFGQLANNTSNPPPYVMVPLKDKHGT